MQIAPAEPQETYHHRSCRGRFPGSKAGQGSQQERLLLISIMQNDTSPPLVGPSSHDRNARKGLGTHFVQPALSLPKSWVSLHPTFLASERQDFWRGMLELKDGTKYSELKFWTPGKKRTTKLDFIKPGFKKTTEERMDSFEEPATFPSCPHPSAGYSLSVTQAGTQPETEYNDSEIQHDVSDTQRSFTMSASTRVRKPARL